MVEGQRGPVGQATDDDENSTGHGGKNAGRWPSVAL